MGKTFQFTLRKKIIAIYVVCILIPVIIVNGILYFLLNEDIFKYENDNKEQSTQRFSVKVSNEINDFTKLLYQMNDDENITTILNDTYQSNNQYTEEKEKILIKQIASYENQNEAIESIKFYTINNTIPNTDYHEVIDSSITQESWYSRLLRSESHKVIITRTIANQDDGYNVLRFYNQNIVPTEPYGKLIASMDLKLDFLDEVVKEEYSQGLYLLVNQYNDIVYASNDQFKGYNAYDSLILFKKDENFYYVEIPDIGNPLLESWRIIGIFPKEIIFSDLIDKRNQIIWVVFIGLFGATLLMTWLSASINRRFKQLKTQVDYIKMGNFTKVPIDQTNDELGDFIDEFNDMTDQMNVLVNEVYQKELQRKNLVIEKQQAELNALQSQVNPHFLYNVMNTIRMKSLIKGETETADILKYAGAMFRRVINWEDDLITIKDEIAFVEEFLRVQKYRFEDRLTYDFQFDQGVLEGLIPKMTLQTFVENASNHGLKENTEGCHIAIIIKSIGEGIHLSVCDNGKGMTPDELDKLKDYVMFDRRIKDHVGLKNVYHRLMIYFKESLYFDIISHPDVGTTIELEIPMMREEQK